MGFFKSLFGLGSKPSGHEWAAGLFGLGSMPAPVATAADWPSVEIDRLPPPAGFTWYPFKEAKITVLRPEGWHDHQVLHGNVFAGLVSKQRLGDEGPFTVLTLNVFRGTKDTLRQTLPNSHPDTAIAGALGGLLPDLPNDRNVQVMYIDPCVQRTRASRLIRAQVRRPDPKRNLMISYYFAIEFDQSPDVYFFIFEAPEGTWDESWKIGKQIMTNLVFSPDPSKALIFSIDPPLAPDDLLQSKVLEAGRLLGWTLAHEDRANGLFVWNIEVEVPRRRQPPSRHAGTFTWCMRRVGNKISLYDPIDLAPFTESSTDFMAAVSIAARQVQEEFKRRWLALVGPVTFQPASPDMVELCVKTAVQVTGVARGLPTVVAHVPTLGQP